MGYIALQEGVRRQVGIITNALCFEELINARLGERSIAPEEAP